MCLKNVQYRSRLRTRRERLVAYGAPQTEQLVVVHYAPSNFRCLRPSCLRLLGRLDGRLYRCLSWRLSRRLSRRSRRLSRRTLRSGRNSVFELT